MITYTNAYGSTLEVLENEKWELRFKRSDVNETKLVINWKRIPNNRREVWMAVAKEVFEKNQPDTAQSLVAAISTLHEWLIFISKDVNNYDEITEIDLGMFNEYLINEKGLKKASRRNVFSRLIKAFEVALLLGIDISPRLIDRIRDIRLYKFKNINNEIYEENSKKVLSIEQLERIQKALIEEFHQCKEVEVEIDKFETKKSPDMFVIVALWMGMKHGMRATELLNLRIQDIKEDLKKGQHKINCVGSRAKPDRVIEINQPTMDILNFFKGWSEEARNGLKTDAFCVELSKVGDKIEPKFIKNHEIISKINRFISRYDLYDINGKAFNIDLKNLRRTYGSIMAAQTNNREIVRQVMGHMDVQTTERHYTAQNKADLSHHVSKALKVFALELAMSYKKPVVELNKELPHIAELLKEEPERDYKYGICHVPKTEDTVSASCKRASNCLECPYLIPESRKLPHYKAERELWFERAQKVTDERVKQQRMRRVQMLDAYIYLIDDAVSKLNKQINEEQPKKKFHKKKYKKR